MGANKQIKTKERVKDFGEVFTNKREIDAMLDMISLEVSRIGSRILEPACGTGNFLVEILNRKLETIKEKAEGNQVRWEYYAFIAIANMYGIDIQEDNVRECRERLLMIVRDEYDKLFNRYMYDFIKSIRYVLDRNIVWGNSLTGLMEDGSGPLVLSEWAYEKQNIIKKDYLFTDLVRDVHIPIREYERVNFKKVFTIE